jgi:hypothetical protein
MIKSAGPKTKPEQAHPLIQNAPLNSSAFRRLRLNPISSFLRVIIPARFRPIGYLQHLTRSRTNSRVHAGPFAGMRYLNVAIGSAYIPKLLGTYESELAEEVEKICASKPDLIVDIGAAEGYYSIGLALRVPTVKVAAFETESRGQVALREMADLNHVSDRVEVYGKCEPADLAASLEVACHPVVICDAEGYEEKLLNLQIVPGLSKATILVELHEFIVPGIVEILKARFKATHWLARVWQQPRSRQQFPWRTLGTCLLPRSYLDWSVSEWRPVRMSWLSMRPHG